MGDFYKLADDTPFNRAVDKAIAEHNAAFIKAMKDPAFREEHDRLADVQSRATWLLVAGHEQREGETLADFIARVDPDGSVYAELTTPRRGA